jgi:hypothetical protein
LKLSGENVKTFHQIFLEKAKKLFLRFNLKVGK